jgi:CPA1 family monovalent cation:H+ antiporter
MRGVLALAAAMSLPKTIANGSAFPYRDLIVFLTFSVILVTLVFQGLTLPPLIRVLGVARRSGPGHEERRARRIVLEAALSELEDARRSDPLGDKELYDDLAMHYKRRMASLDEGRREQEAGKGEHYLQYLELSRALLAVERRTALRLRDQHQVADETVREIEHELDLSEARLITLLDASHVRG